MLPVSRLLAKLLTGITLAYSLPYMIASLVFLKCSSGYVSLHYINLHFLYDKIWASGQLLLSFQGLVLLCPLPHPLPTPLPPIHSTPYSPAWIFALSVLSGTLSQPPPHHWVTIQWLPSSNFPDQGSQSVLVVPSHQTKVVQCALLPLSSGSTSANLAQFLKAPPLILKSILVWTINYLVILQNSGLFFLWRVTLWTRSKLCLIHKCIWHRAWHTEDTICLLNKQRYLYTEKVCTLIRIRMWFQGLLKKSKMVWLPKFKD